MKAVLVVLVLLALDQWTKYYTIGNFVDPLVIFDWFRFLYVRNMGVAFSIPVPSIFVLIATVGISAWLVRVIVKRGFYWKYILLLSGAIGNGIDRVYHGFVVDFISIGNFPVFNMADIYISIGIGLFLLEEWMGES